MSAEVKGTGRQVGAMAYPDIEHQHEIESSMAAEQENGSELGQLEPWYPQLGQAKEEDEFDNDPFQEEPCAVVLVFHQRYPVVELPGHKACVYSRGIEALCRRIEDGEGYDWVPGGILCSQMFGSWREGIPEGVVIGRRVLGSRRSSSGSKVCGRGRGETPRYPSCVGVHGITVGRSK